jgi:hypothetical protein
VCRRRFQAQKGRCVRSGGVSESEKKFRDEVTKKKNPDCIFTLKIEAFFLCVVLIGHVF